MSDTRGGHKGLLFGVVAGLLLSAAGILLYRLARRHPGVAQRAGQKIDASVKKAVDGLTQAASAIEPKGGEVHAQRAGRAVDEAVTEAKSVLHKTATSIHAAHNGK